MPKYFTTGQAAKRLRVSVSTLKRWLESPEIEIEDRRNQNAWRLFAESDMVALHAYKRQLRRNGRRFNDTTLIPVIVNGKNKDTSGESLALAAGK